MLMPECNENVGQVFRCHTDERNLGEGEMSEKSLGNETRRGWYRSRRGWVLGGLESEMEVWGLIDGTAEAESAEATALGSCFNTALTLSFHHRDASCFPPPSSPYPFLRYPSQKRRRLLTLDCTHYPQYLIILPPF